MSRDFIVSYGSLLSRESRTTFSTITASVAPVTVSGWKRSWCTRHLDEHATHAGAIRAPDAQMHGVMVPTELTDDIRRREQYYEFEEIDPSTLKFANGIPDTAVGGTFWICKPRRIDYPTRDYPLPQSYVDTCLIGCLETDIPEWPNEFIRTTDGWEHYWINDRNRDAPIFPRAARLSPEVHDVID